MLLLFAFIGLFLTLGIKGIFIGLIITPIMLLWAYLPDIFEIIDSYLLKNSSPEPKQKRGLSGW